MDFDILTHGNILIPLFVCYIWVCMLGHILIQHNIRPTIHLCQNMTCCFF